MDVGVHVGGDSRPQEVTVDVGPSFHRTEVVLVIVISCEQSFPDWFVQGDPELSVMVQGQHVTSQGRQLLGLGHNTRYKNSHIGI